MTPQDLDSQIRTLIEQHCERFFLALDKSLIASRCGQFIRGASFRLAREGSHVLASQEGQLFEDIALILNRYLDTLFTTTPTPHSSAKE